MAAPLTPDSGVPAGLVLVTWSTDPDRGADALLGGILGREVRTVRVCPACGSDRHGRPVIASPAGTGCSVSVARAGQVSVVALSTCGPVGVDVEAAGNVGHLAGVVHHEAEHGQPQVLRTWVRKESLLKATGQGLSVDPSRIRLSRPDQPAALLAWDAPDAPDVPVRMFDVAGPPGHVTALTVLTGHAPRVEVTRAAPAARAGRATR